MMRASSGHPGLHDIVVEIGDGKTQWRIVDHWRDVFVLERKDGSGKRRFAYAEELEDMSKFRPLAQSAPASRAKQV